MITVVHGDDLSASRNFLQSARSNEKNCLFFQGSSMTVTDLTQALSNNGLFEESKTIIIENLVSQKKVKNELKSLADILTNNSESHQIYLWEGKVLTAAQIKLFGSINEKLFKLPQSLFQFLESLYPNNLRSILHNYELLLKSAERELIFFMIVRQFRLLLSSFSAESVSIDEMKRVAPWQKNKLKIQSRKFSEKKLLELYKLLGQIDNDSKIGARDLSSSIDFFLLKI